MRLYRPVGLNELRLIFATEMTAFPPRLPEQPIFYPVLNAPYAIKIARDWNTKNEMRAGYVTEFEVEDAYVSRFEPHIVGSRVHEELWVPAAELAEFNTHIQDKIRVIEAYFGEGFTGYAPERFGLAGKDAIEQFVAIAASIEHYAFDLWYEIVTNCLAVFLHYPFWAQQSFEPQGISHERRNEDLRYIDMLWRERNPDMPPLCYAESV
jgi:hypothetical protein